MFHSMDNLLKYSNIELASVSSKYMLSSCHEHRLPRDEFVACGFKEQIFDHGLLHLSHVLTFPSPLVW